MNLYFIELLLKNQVTQNYLVQNYLVWAINEEDVFYRLKKQTDIIDDNNIVNERIKKVEFTNGVSLVNQY